MTDQGSQGFHCHECGQELPVEFLNRLRDGQPVFCEYCGSRIKINPGEVADLPRAGRQDIKKENSLKSPKKLPPSKTPKEIAPEMNAVLAQQRKTSPPPPNPPAQQIAYYGPGARGASSVSVTNNRVIVNFINFLNALSLPLGLVILILAGTAQITSNFLSPSYYGFLGNLPQTIAAIICGASALVVDAHFHRMVQQRDYSFRGIDLMIWGFLGCFGYGVGALILAKGCMILYSTAQVESGYPRLTKSQWVNIFISRLNANSARVSIVIWVATFGIILSTIVIPMVEVYNLVFTAMGLGVFILDAAVFTPQLHGAAPARRKQGRGAILFGAGIIGCLNYGMGIVLLLKGIAVILFSNMPGVPAPARVPAPVGDTITPATPVPPPTISTPEVIPRPVISQAQGPSPSIKYPTQAENAPGPLMGARRPAPSQPITPPTRAMRSVERGPGKLGKPTPDPLKPAQSAPTTPSLPPNNTTDNFENRAAIRDYLNRVYTVLSSKIRDRVMRLDIPESEKREVLDGLLYLMPDEQDQFLVELEELARKLIPEIVGRVLRLNLSKDQNEKLLEQLEYLSDQEQVEFVQELERARFGAA